MPWAPNSVSPLELDLANSNPCVQHSLTVYHDVLSVRLFLVDVDGSGRTGVILSY